MPNPLEALQKAQTIGAGPTERKRALFSEAGDQPMSQGVMPMLPEGALSGLMGMAGRLFGGGAKVAPAAPQAVQGGIQGLPAGAEAMIQRLSAGARPVVEGLQRAGAFAGDRTVGGLHQAATLGSQAAEFTPQGGEALYNAGKGAVQKAADPAVAAYQRILAAGGR